MIDLKPSHFGSKLSAPSGICGTDLASIGATGGMTGKRTVPIVADPSALSAVEAPRLEPVAFGREQAIVSGETRGAGRGGLTKRACRGRDRSAASGWCTRAADSRDRRRGGDGAPFPQR